MSSLYLNRELDPVSAVIGARMTLRGDEARHAVMVGRTRVGERISIGNGEGLLVTGDVVSAEASNLVIEVASVRTEPWPEPALWLVQALAKGDRDELAIQAATELGVSGVIPWAAERSVTRWEGPKVAKGEARWASIVREATKQSIRSWVPVVEPLVATANLVKSVILDRAIATVLVLDPAADAALASLEIPTSSKRIVLVVGPEGGISPREFEMLTATGATRVRLGQTVLRTSTAGPAALAVLNAKLGCW